MIVRLKGWTRYRAKFCLLAVLKTSLPFVPWRLLSYAGLDQEPRAIRFSHASGKAVVDQMFCLHDKYCEEAENMKEREMWIELTSSAAVKSLL